MRNSKGNSKSTPKHFRWGSLRRIFSALVSGGLFYAFWLLVYLVIRPADGFIETFLWAAAPLATGVGFAVGTSVYNMYSGEEQGGFFRIASWTIPACIAGALAVYWYGPMLIVFSMLAAGMLSVFVRDIFLRRSAEKK